MTSSWRRSFAALLSAAALLAGLLLVAGPAGASSISGPAAAAAAVTEPSAAHPYSSPDWFPLHNPTKISCVRSNCTPSGGKYHGYWAMDLLNPDNQPGDPVYAAGAGVFHIGSNDRTCATKGGESGGTWVWVDHGAGVVSRYQHLTEIRAKEGQLVTPATVIATMGHGPVAPCATNYLHFEVRTGGVRGTRVDPGPLWVCTDGRRDSWPKALPGGKASWDALDPRSFVTPATTSECVTDTWSATPDAPPRPAGARGNGWIRVSWPTPGVDVGQVVAALETYHPSVSAWGAPEYRTLSASTRNSTFKGLQNGRRYRVKVAFTNASGSSAWSTYRALTPAAKPSTPKAPRWLTASSSMIRYAWWKSATRGTPVTSYTVAIRQRTATSYTDWRYLVVSASVLNHNWTSVLPGRTYQVTVRADSAVGSSAFASRRSVTVPR